MSMYMCCTLEYKWECLLVLSWSYVLCQFTINDETEEIFQVINNVLLNYMIINTLHSMVY